jgi:hypothetical protein
MRFELGLKIDRGTPDQGSLESLESLSPNWGTTWLPSTIRVNLFFAKFLQCRAGSPEVRQWRPKSQTTERKFES